MRVYATFGRHPVSLGPQVPETEVSVSLVGLVRRIAVVHASVQRCTYSTYWRTWYLCRSLHEYAAAKNTER